MSTYTNSKGDQIDTSTLAQPHLERALAKAQREDNIDNTKALQAEMQTRGQATDNNSVETESPESLDTIVTDENTYN